MGADPSHELCKIKVKQLEEISGLAASGRNPDVLWVNNDGDAGQLFAVSMSGELVAVARCRAAIKDVEDIAIGPGPEPGVEYLYLGDVGDNHQRRSEVRVVRFAEPELSGERGQELDVDEFEEIRLTYPDGPHDAETMFVDPKSGALYIVTKEKRRARLYAVAPDQMQDQTVAMLTAAGELEVDEISAGAISRDGSRILLRREGRGWLWERGNTTVAQAMVRKPTKVPVLGKRQGPNGESIAFSVAGDSYYTVSEGKRESIYEFDLP
jgi:hypothetical protein